MTTSESWRQLKVSSVWDWLQERRWVSEPLLGLLAVEELVVHVGVGR